MIELNFPVLGGPLPTDHGFALYGAISRLAPKIHDSTDVSIGPIGGTYIGNGQLQLGPQSRLRIRLPSTAIGDVLPLAGKPLTINDCRVRLGVPQVQALVPATSLYARLVSIKTKDRNTEPDALLDAVRRKFGQQAIKAEPAIPLQTLGPHAGKPRRRIVRIHGRKVVGFSLLVEGLSALDSLKLQEAGLGGRLKMGCGFFVPAREGV